MNGELQGYKVEIPDPPVVDGWEAVEYRIPNNGEMFVAVQSGKVMEAGCTVIWTEPRWIMRRKPRRRIVFEECGEPSFYLGGGGHMVAPYLMPDGTQISHVKQARWIDPKRACWLRRTDEEVGE